MGAITVALAEEREAAACLALLPDAQGLPAELLIARRGGEFAGAAALIWRNWSQPAGFPITVQVLPADRRKGVGRSLVAAAVSLAAGETPGLWSLSPTAEDGAAAAFMGACGFVVQRRQHHFLADIAPLLDHLRPQVRRLRSHGHVPAEARIVPLAEAPLEEVGWLVSAEFGGGPVRALQRLERRGVNGAARSRSERSMVALQGDRVAGVLLCGVKDGVGVVDGWITAPAWRNGWPNLLLFEAVLSRSQDDGLEEFRFHCDDAATHTLSLAKRCAATEVARSGLYYYALAED